MSNDNKYITIIIVLIIAIVGLIIIYNINKPEVAPQENINKQEEKKKEEPIDNSKVELKEDTFVKNQVIISFKNSAEEILNSIENITKVEIIGDNTYVITFENDFPDLESLNTYCTNLQNSHNEIEYCESNQIIKIDDCSKGPC